MDRGDIELFLTIIQCNSVTKAADILHFSQSTVSYRLKSLEKELEVDLFHRRKGTRTAELTIYGEMFVPIAKRWMESYQDALDLKYYPQNILSVASIVTINNEILPDIYRAVIGAETPLRLEVKTGYSSTVYHLVEDRLADIGFVAELESRKNIVTIPLFRQKYYVVRNTRHPEPSRRLAPQELDPRFEIYCRWDDLYEDWHNSIWGKGAGPYVELDCTSALQPFLTDEKYWAIVPSSHIPRAASLPGFIQVDELDIQPEVMRTCYMVKNAYPKPSREIAMQMFEAALWHYLPKLPGIEVIR